MSIGQLLLVTCAKIVLFFRTTKENRRFFMNDVTRRFIETYKEMGLTGYRMGKKCPSITKQKISNIENNLTEASIDMVSNFCEIYSNVNANYILTGKGPMFLDNETSHSSLTEKDVEDLPSPETAEYWKRMYETTVVMYEAQFEDLQRRFNVLNKSVEEIQDLFSERRKAV